MKKSKEYSANTGRGTVETVDFEAAEAEKLEFVKKHMGLNQSKDVIKALICEKCDSIKRIQEEQRKQKNAEDTAMAYLETDEYKCPM